MVERISKPRVFLSHSKADVVFIEQLYEDLRKCQIEPWLDTEEIRHGHPWLDAIFEDGLPACDCVLVYLTESSVCSRMVKKEIDASIIQQLKDSSISFLPYVSESSIRSRLRPDLQILQAPELNDGNYKELLPRIVAEIWRSYLERKVVSAIKSEQVRRLEAELELERIKSTSEGKAFSGNESADFKYVYNALNRPEKLIIEISSQVIDSDQKQPEWIVQFVEQYEVNLSSLIPFISSPRTFEYSHRGINDLLIEQLHSKKERDKNKNNKYECKQCPELSDELLMYGLLTRVHIPPPQGEGRIARMMYRSYKLAYTEKMEKFKYWMAFNKKMPLEIAIHPVDE